MRLTKIILRILISLLSCVLIFTIPFLNEHVIKQERDIFYFNTGNYAKVENLQTGVGGQEFQKFNSDGELIDSGTYSNGQFLGQFGNFVTNWELLASLVFILTAIYCLFFLQGDIRNIKDLINKRKQKEFISLSAKHQLELIKKNINCPKCLHNPNLKIISEKHIENMIFVWGYCSICNEEKKIRIK